MKKRLIGSYLLFLILLTVFSMIWMLISSKLILLEINRSPESPLSREFIERVANQTKVINGQLTVNPAILRYLKDKRVWIQILDENGTEIFSQDRPAKMPTHYIPGQLVSYQRYGQELIGYRISTWYKQVDSRTFTWVLGRDKKLEVNDKESPEFETRFMIFNLIGWIFLVFLVAVLFSIWLGNPLFYIWKWLQRLSQGIYTEPVGRTGRPISLNRSGRMKRSFQTYREVIGALQRLTQTLKQNEIERAKLEKTREEWLTGVSHDLKTPLSTIKGYIDILAAKKYQLNEAELDQILETVSQRIGYIEELLADFTLTFQLKNNALPLHREKENIVELVRESVIELVNHPEADAYDIQFEPMVDEVIDCVDKKWYKRAIDNLLGNAFLHNPKGTRVVVTIDQWEKGYEIVIADNGKGMDEETKARLFERYFRGTHSGSEIQGSGLGMAIAYQLIGIHDGKIRLQSALGQGTVIRIHFSKSHDGIPDVETGMDQIESQGK